MKNVTYTYQKIVDETKREIELAIGGIKKKSVPGVYGIHDKTIKYISNGFRLVLQKTFNEI